MTSIVRDSFRGTALLGALAIATIAPAAAEPLHLLRGLVLAVDAARGTVVVRPISSDSTGETTAAFRLARSAGEIRVAPGATIDAELDPATRPPTLRVLRIVAVQPLAADAPPAAGEASANAVAPLATGAIPPAYPLRASDGETFTIARFLGAPLVVRLAVVSAANDAEATRRLRAALDATGGGTVLSLAAATAPSASSATTDLREGGGIRARLDPTHLAAYAAALGLRTDDPSAAALLDRNGRYLGIVQATDATLARTFAAAHAVAFNPIASADLRIESLAGRAFGERGARFASGGDAIFVGAILAAFAWAFIAIGRAIAKGA